MHDYHITGTTADLLHRSHKRTQKLETVLMNLFNWLKLLQIAAVCCWVQETLAHKMIPHTVYWNDFCWTFTITLAIVLIWSFAMKFLLNSLHQKSHIFNRNLTSRNRLIKCIHPLSTHQWQLAGCISLSTPAMTLHLFTLVGLLWCCCSFLGWESFSVPKNPHTHNYCHKWVILFCSPKGPVWSGKGDSSASLTDGSLFLSFSPLLPLSWAQTHSLRLRLNEYNRN